MLNWNLTNHGCSVWKGICDAREDFWKFGLIEPGQGGFGTLFWRDVWNRGVRLCDLFPRVAAIATPSISFISDLVDPCDRFKWKFSCNHVLRGGARRELEEFIRWLDFNPPGVWQGPSRIRWPLLANERFTVASFYQALRSTFEECIDDDFPWATIWEKQANPRARIFLWTAVHEGCLTIDNLKKRGFSLTNWCCLCKAEEESISHLLVQCNISRYIWEFFFKLFKIVIPMPKDLKGLAAMWVGVKSDQACFSSLVRILPHAICWAIWKERNNRIFQDEERSINSIISQISRWIACWICSTNRELASACDDFLKLTASSF
ncbi:hypothetical protein LINPERPRIM_LOCUS39462 [Linum perenne]